MLCYVEFGMRALRVGMVGIAIVVTLSAQPKDIDGWDKIKWGMTMADARAAYSIEAQPEAGEYGTTLRLKPVRIGDISLAVSIGTKHGSEQISQVSLDQHYGFPSDPPFDGPHVFDTLKTPLIQKYGPPKNQETRRESHNIIKSVLWTFPSTTIVLEFRENDVVTPPELRARGWGTIGSVTLTYMATDKKALDVL